MEDINRKNEQIPSLIQKTDILSVKSDLNSETQLEKAPGLFTFNQPVKAPLAAKESLTSLLRQGNFVQKGSSNMFSNIPQTLPTENIFSNNIAQNDIKLQPVVSLFDQNKAPEKVQNEIKINTPEISLFGKNFAPTNAQNDLKINQPVVSLFDQNQAPEKVQNEIKIKQPDQPQTIPTFAQNDIKINTPEISLFGKNLAPTNAQIDIKIKQPEVSILDQKIQNNISKQPEISLFGTLSNNEQKSKSSEKNLLQAQNQSPPKQTEGLFSNQSLVKEQEKPQKQPENQCKIEIYRQLTFFRLDESVNKLLIDFVLQRKWKDFENLFNKEKDNVLRQLEQAGTQYFKCEEKNQIFEEYKLVMHWNCSPSILQSISQSGQINLALICNMLSQYLDINKISCKQLMDSYFQKSFSSPDVKKFVNYLNESSQKKIQILGDSNSKSLYNTTDYYTSFRNSIFQEYLADRLLPLEFLQNLIFTFQNMSKNNNLQIDEKKSPKFFLNYSENLINQLYKQYTEIQTINFPTKLQDSDMIDFMINLLKEQLIILELLISLINLTNYVYPLDQQIRILQLVKSQAFCGNWLRIKNNVRTLDIKENCKQIMSKLVQKLEISCFFFTLSIFNLRKLFQEKNQQKLKFLPDQDILINQEQGLQMMVLVKFVVQQVQLMSENQTQIKEFKDNPFYLLKHLLKNKYMFQSNIKLVEIFTDILKIIACIICGNIEKDNDNIQSKSYISVDILIHCFRNNQKLINDYFSEISEDPYSMKNIWSTMNSYYIQKKYKFMRLLLGSQGQYSEQILYDQEDWHQEIFRHWYKNLKTLNKSVSSDLEYSINYNLKLMNQEGNLLSQIKLICQILIKNPRLLTIVEQKLFNFEEGQGVGVGVIMILLDTYYYFSRIHDQLHFKILIYILKAIQSLFETPQLRNLVINLIQIYPSTLKNYDIISSPHPIAALLQTDFLQKKTDLKTQVQNLKFLKRILKFFKTIFQVLELPQQEFFKHGTSLEPESPKIIQIGDRLSQRFADYNQFYGFDIEISNQNLQIKSNFLTNFYFFTYNTVCNLWSNLSSMIDERGYKFEIGALLFEITNLNLQKIIRNPSRVVMANSSTPPSFPFIHEAPIYEMIISIFQIQNSAIQHINPDEIQLKNSYLLIYGEDSAKIIIAGQKLLETILNVIDSHLQNTILINSITLIKNFYQIFISKTKQHYYTIECSDNENKRRFSFNFIQAIATNCLEELGNQKIKKQLTREEVFQTQEQNENFYEFMMASYQDNISSISFRLLTRLMMVWERDRILTDRQHSLFLNLQEINNEDHYMSYPNNTYLDLLNSIMQKFLPKKLKLLESFYEIGVFLDFLQICVISQQQVSNLILRKQQFLDNKKVQPLDSLIQFISIWFTKNTLDVSTTNKILHLVNKLVDREGYYHCFVKQIRSISDQLYQKIGYKLVNDLESFSQLPKIRLFQHQQEIIQNSVNQTQVDYSLQRKMVTFDSVSQFLKLMVKESQIHINKTLFNLNQILLNLHLEIFKLIFSEDQISFKAYATEFNQIGNEMFRLLNPEIQQSVILWCEEFTQDENPLIICNQFGYGKNFIYDTKEMVAVYQTLRSPDSKISADLFMALFTNFNSTSSFIIAKQEFLEMSLSSFQLICSISQSRIGMSAISSNALEVVLTKPNFIMPNDHLIFNISVKETFNSLFLKQIIDQFMQLDELGDIRNRYIVTSLGALHHLKDKKYAFNVPNWNHYHVFQISMAQHDHLLLLQSYVYFLSILESLEGRNLQLLRVEEINTIDVMKQILLGRQAQDNLSLVMAILTSLIKLCEDQFLEFIIDENKDPLLPLILELAFSHELANATTFYSIQKFLIEFCWSGKGIGSKILYQNNLQCRLIKSNFLQLNSTNNEDEHLIWCWMINTYTQFVINIQDEVIYFLEAKKFLGHFQDRIISVLQFQGEKSLQKLEELDLILKLLISFYTANFQFSQPFDLLENFLQILATSTVKLFNFKNSEELVIGYKPKTQIEIYLSQIQCKTSLDDPLIYQSEPFKKQKNNFYQESIKLSYNQVLFNKSLYSLQVQLKYLDILNNLLFIFSLAIPQSNLVQIINEGFLLNNNIWQQSYFEQFAHSLLNLQKFLGHQIQELRTEEFYNNMLSKSLQKLNAITYSILGRIDQGQLNAENQSPSSQQIEINLLYSGEYLFKTSIHHLIIWKHYKDQFQGSQTIQCQNIKQQFENNMQVIFNSLNKFHDTNGQTDDTLLCQATTLKGQAQNTLQQSFDNLYVQLKKIEFL